MMHGIDGTGSTAWTHGLDLKPVAVALALATGVVLASSRSMAADAALPVAAAAVPADAVPTAAASPIAADAVPVAAAADDTAQYDDLEGELSRADLFSATLGEEGLDADGVGHFALKTPFRFPGDVLHDGDSDRTNALFGIDISHYTGDIRLDTLVSKQKVFFVYVKASDGLRGKSGHLSKDTKFRQFWSGLGALKGDQRVYRGAYHFLRADVPADQQAKVLLDQLRAAGGIVAADLPPVLDLEPDNRFEISSSGGGLRWYYDTPSGVELGVRDDKKHLHDFWQDRKPAEIIALINEVSKAIETGTGGKKPMVYTLTSWWQKTLGKNVGFDQLPGLRLWIADYGSSSSSQTSGVLHDEQPRTPANARWTLWQFTEQSAFAAGYAGRLDANIYKGTPEQFRQDLGVEALK